MAIRLASTALVALLVGCAPATEAVLPAEAGAERIFSSTGFSFLPPQDRGWTEEFSQNEVTYLKQTDLEQVSFYVGAIEGITRAALTDEAELVAFVRNKKDMWGPDGRYSETTGRFRVEAQRRSCVRYTLTAKDHGAANKGKHAFLLMTATGRFCLHPDDRTAAIDIFYSARHIPTFDPRSLIAEGERFLEGLDIVALPVTAPGQRSQAP
jgi:hypothetical protein